jgi:hypothetical protein
LLEDEAMKAVMAALKEDLQDPDAKADWDKGEEFYYQLENAIAILSLRNKTFNVNIIGARKLPVKVDIFVEAEE